MRPRASWFRHGHARRRLEMGLAPPPPPPSSSLGAVPSSPAASAAEAVAQRVRRVAANAARWHNDTVRLSRGVQEPGVLGHLLARGTKRLVITQGCKFQKPFFIQKPPHGGYKLETLRVETFAMDQGLHALLKCCRRLREVRLRTSVMTPGILSGLLRNEKLEKIDLSTFRGCTFDQLMAIVRNCRRLIRWRSEGISPLTSAQLSAFVGELPNTLLDIAFTPDFSMTARDDHIYTLVQACPNIEHLDLHGCRELTHATIDHLQLLHNLHSLDLTLCGKLNLETLLKLVSFKELQTLDVSRYVLSFQEVCKLRAVLPAVNVRTSDPE